MVRAFTFTAFKTDICKATLILFMLLFVRGVQAETLHFSTLDWCPFVCPQDKEKPGFLVEYVQTIFKNTPYKIKIKAYPWSRAIKYTESGETLALLGPAKEEAPNLIFPKSEIGQQRFCFFTRTEDSWMFGQPSSVMGRTVMVPQDAFPAALNEYRHKAQFKFRPYNNDYVRLVLEMLRVKRIDTILLTYNSMMNFLSAQPFVRQEIKYANCISKQNLYLAFTPNIKKRAQVDKVMAVFEREIALLRKKNYLQDLLVKYQLD